MEALRFIDSLYQDATHEVVIADRDLERAAVDGWLRRFRDQPSGLADVVSFEVMRQRVANEQHHVAVARGPVARLLEILVAVVEVGAGLARSALAAQFHRP